MSYLAIAKAAAARLRETSPGNAVDAVNAESGTREGDYRVNRAPESGFTAPDPAAVARLLGLPLNKVDRVIEVRVRWLPMSLWFVPDEAGVEMLLSEGVTRGRIWTTSELLDLLNTDITKASARTLAVVKLQFDGDVVDVRACEGR